jgi:integrase
MSLTDKQINALKPEAKSRKYFDGGGMYLEVSPSGGKLWRLKYRVNGVEKRISLGAYPEVSLKEARDKAYELRKTVREGLDPSVERRRAKVRSRRLFVEVGREWFAKEKDAWTDHHRIATESRLNRLIYPRIGDMPIDTLLPPDVLALCNAVNTFVSVYMARLVRSLCGRIFRYAVTCGYIPSDPSRDLADALPAHRHKPMAALVEPKDIARLMKAIAVYDGDFRTCCALKLLPLLMVRTGELRAAEWTEFDFADKLWRIPGHKMKMGRDHLVPLSRQSLEILLKLKEVTGYGKYLLPGRRSDNRIMSENTVNAALRYMGFAREEMTGHGFRSMASTRLNEMGFRADIIEKQLAHEQDNSVRKAYNRAEYLNERRDMLQKWADYLDDLRDGKV